MIFALSAAVAVAAIAAARLWWARRRTHAVTVIANRYRRPGWAPLDTHGDVIT